MDAIQRVVESMEPEEALNGIAANAGRLFSLVSEEARLKFVVGLIGEAGADKVASLVQL